MEDYGVLEWLHVLTATALTGRLVTYTLLPTRGRGASGEAHSTVQASVHDAENVAAVGASIVLVAVAIRWMVVKPF